MKNKYFLLFIGFLISWLYSMSVFYPQPGGFDWIGTAFFTLLYGYPWIVLITFFVLGASNDKTKIRKLLVHKYFTFSLMLFLGLTLLISWNFKFSNDLIFIGFWILIMLLWWNTYLNLKKLLIEGFLEKQKSKINVGPQIKDELDENFIKAIIEKLKDRLERNLTTEEFNVFTLKRSGTAYEMILDFISDKELTKTEIENYVQKVIQENK